MQMNHYTTDEAEIALQKVKTFLMEKKAVKKINKVDLINESVVICAKLLTSLDSETLEQVL
jgi:hypothetical protein